MLHNIMKAVNYTHHDCTVASGRARYNNGVTTTSGEGSTMSGAHVGSHPPEIKYYLPDDGHNINATWFKNQKSDTEDLSPPDRAYTSKFKLIILPSKIN